MPVIAPGWRPAASLGQGTSMDHGKGVMHMVEGPVVDAADPFDPEGRTAEIAHDGLPEPVIPAVDDPLVPPPGSGLRGWASRVGGVVRRDWPHLLPFAALAALPMHFFVGRVDDTVIVAPALSDLAGGFGLLLLPAMWLAYFAVSALPLVICLAGAVGVVVPVAAVGLPPRPRAVWALVAFRLRALWLWFAGFGVVTGGLPLLLSAERIGPAAAGPWAVVLTVLATAVLAFTGVLGCVLLIERGHDPRRAAHLLGLAPTFGLIVGAAAVTVLPRIADAWLGGLASTVVAVVAAQLWAIAALVTYAQARAAEVPVTSAALHAELAAPED